ncbi:uncharacterized protein [Haliotis asinina]|uniref:uncharacterized protein n=1 Tax=Haliotis asinina TaxID=109174 RepID=UPI003531EF44
MSRVQPHHASISSDENKETTMSKSILHILNPVLTFMRICGACTGPNVTVENIACSDYRFRLRHKKNWLQILYCVFGNTYIWIFTGMLAYKLVFFKPMSRKWIIAFQFLAMNITTSSAYTWSSMNFRDGSYQSWVKDFYLYEQSYGVHENMKNMVKKSRILVALVMFFGICIPGSMSTFALSIREVGDIVCVVDGTLSWWNYLIPVINYFIWCTTLSSSAIQLVIGSYCLCSELDVINTNMERCVDQYIKRQESQRIQSQTAPDCHNERNEELKDIIGRHKHMSSLISRFGNFIAFYLCIGLFMSLPLSCFALYVIMTRVESQSNVAVCTFILLVTGLGCITLSILGATVNVKAHTALQCMLKIPTNDLSESTMSAVNQFTSLLTGTTIGYNVYGLFTISPPTLLTIVGTLVTYVVVVLQFRQPDSQTSLSTLCQDLLANVTLLLGDIRKGSSGS